MDGLKLTAFIQIRLVACVKRGFAVTKNSVAGTVDSGYVA